MLTVCFHLVAGLLSATLLTGVIPAAMAVTAASVKGKTEELFGRTRGSSSPAVAVLLGLGCAMLALVSTWALVTLSAPLVGRLLGPTAADLLEVAMGRLQAESEHSRLARELHDGIGHALTIIGVQAAAGCRALGRDPK